MEAAQYNPPAQKLNEDILSSDDAEGILSSNVNSSFTNISGVTQNLNNGDEINKDIKEHTNGEIEDISTSDTAINSAVKSMSPTIIEHAFNVMKNLFSPDKSKSKPTGVANIIINPAKPQQNSPEASSASVLVQENSVHCTEAIGVEIVDDVVQVRTPDTQIPKDEMSHLGTLLSPIVQDVHNNTDDSFLTTVSLIDESFQSAITHIDGNGEGVKLGSNPVEHLLNNSRDLDISDICNDSFEGNDHSLENTLLKNGSIDHLDNESNGSREGNLEILNSTQIASGHDKDQNEKMAEVLDVATTQVLESLKGNPVSVNGNSKVHLEKHPHLGIGGKVDEVLKEIAMDCTSFLNGSNPFESCQNVDMENLFVNRRFENTQSATEGSKPIPLIASGKIEGNPRGNTGKGEEKLHAEDKVKTEAIPLVSLENSYVNTNANVENCKDVEVDEGFSTTTVVLGSGDIDDLEDNDRLSLTEDDLGENSFSSSSSSPSAKMVAPSEVKNKPPQILPSPNRGQKSTPVKNVKNETKKSNAVIKSPGKKASKSEGSSPNKSPKTKNRLNKSADDSSSTRSVDSLKQRPSSKGDTPAKGKELLGNNQHLTSPSFNQTKKISGGNSIEEPATAIVLSQESYTILNAPSCLERPVIKSPTEACIEESKTPCDGLIDRSRQSTPVCEKTVTQKLVPKPEGLEVKSLIATGSPEFKSTPAVNGESTEFSPVTPIMDHAFAFENSSEREESNCSQSQSTELNSTWVTSAKQTNEMNRTYDKKPEALKILNQTYDKSADGVKMNITYDKEPVLKVKAQPDVDGREMNKTFDKNQNSVQFVSVQDAIKDKPSDASTVQVDITNMVNDNSNGIRGNNPKRPSYDGDSTITVGSEVNNLSDLTGKFNAMNIKEESSPNNVVLLEDQLDSAFKLQCDPDLVQLIQEQFTSTDIEKICSVVDDISSMKLSSQIMKASEQFDKSFHESVAEVKTPGTETKSRKPVVNPLSPQSFDFLNSITGKPTGRDLSRESLYVKFDPLVQAPNANSLIDFTKEAEILPTIEASPEMSETGTNVCEQLLAISPEKKPDDIVPPLTPLSHKNKTNAKEDKFEKLKELQNEIFFLKNLYAEREKANKGKMEDYEIRVAKLTGENCVLEEKLKESSEREKSLVRKLNEQSQNLEQLKVIMNEYIKVIAKLTEELETVRTENAKQVDNLTSEKDSYLTHLQNTEAAFTDVHTKYEKSKKTILSLKANESLYKTTLAEQASKLEEFKEKARQAQEKATTEFHKFQLEMEELKGNHAQETTRLRAQLRKTELKLEAMQESLDQKIKENEQLTVICDELIEGKK